MTKLEYLFKTIEFTKVDEVTQYAVTKIKPVFSGDMYALYPDETFVYSSLEEMTNHLKALLQYNDDLINDFISTLLLDTLRTYYKPLYTIKWYIGGLYDYMRTNQYKSASDKDSLFVPLMDDSKIKDLQNESLGYVFPERVMRLIRNKPINRIRMYIKASPINSYYKSDVHYFDNFLWVKTSQFNPDQGGESVGIKVPGNNVYTYMWVVYGVTTNDTQLTSSFDPDKHRYIGISCNNISNTVKTLPSADANPSNRWPDYAWQEISLSDPEDPDGDPDTPSYVYLGSFTYHLYVRYTDNKESGSISKYSVDNMGKMYRYIGFFLSLTAPSSYAIEQNSSYKWYTITTLKNVILYDIDDKRYFLYVRFTNSSETNVFNNITDSNDIAYIRASFFNCSNITTHYSFTNISSYEAKIPFNLYSNNKYQHGLNSRYAWIKFADSLTPTLNEMYEYGIYKLGSEKKIRNYLFVGLNKDNDSETTNPADYYKVKIFDLTTEYSYNATTYTDTNAIADTWIHIKFAEKIPQTITDATNYYNLNKTVYIGISITEVNGLYHNVQTNQETPLEAYFWVPIIELPLPTQFTKERYVYFTYSNDITDPNDRLLCPVYTNDAENVVNKKLFGYAYDLDVSISNKHRLVNEVDKTSREITLYRADSLNALSETHIHKITTINIPYTTMGKYSVFNFDSTIINDNEYLIIGGNRDNTCVLTCANNFSYNSDGTHPDYSLENTDIPATNDARPQVSTSDVMYYTNANFLTLDNWTPVSSKYLPIDIGCGFATASNEVQVTTKGFKEILEETQLNDQVALELYKAENSDKYKSPNYNLYVNLTYKFAKIIDGNIDYMPLYNHYKIKYKFKNENQQILQLKVFDTSVITPDGSVYNKPTQIIINDVTYTKNSQKYLDYFDYIEGDFTQTIKETDQEVTDKDYDVAYFQCNNILEQLYQSNNAEGNSQLYTKDYYNYKYLADDSHKEYLPVLCEVTISAYETNTALYTRTIPVTLAAYSLVEITDDYIRTTVSKIENDYIYGLTQRTSRIEQYADRISMSVLNVTLGLYSRIQMTEDKILMEVVDASKNIGSMFNITAEKILSLVYDTSDHMYSLILLQKNKISLEVANDFRKAGIYLTANSAKIDAPNIVLRGDRTTVMGTLLINQKKDQGKGIVMFDEDNYDRIHVTTEELPSRLSLTGSSEKKSAIILSGTLGTFTRKFNINIYTNIHDNIVIDTEAYNLEFIGLKFTNFSFRNPFNNNYVSYITDILQLSKIHGKLRIYPRKLKEEYSSRNILYGAGEPSITFQWEYNNRVPASDEVITIYNGANQDLPILHFDGIPSGSITIVSDNDLLFSSFTKELYNTNYYKINYTINQNGQGTLSASYATTIDGTAYTGSTLCTILIQALPSIQFKIGNSIVTECNLYYDDIENSALPKMYVTNGDVSDITVNISSNKIDIDSAGLLYIVNANNISSSDAGNITVTATFNSISTTLTIKVHSHFGIDIPTPVEPETIEYEWDTENMKEYDIDLRVDTDYKIPFYWTRNEFILYDYWNQEKYPSILIAESPSLIKVELDITSVEWKPYKKNSKIYNNVNKLYDYNYQVCLAYNPRHYLWFQYGNDHDTMDTENFIAFTFRFPTTIYINAVDIIFDGRQTFQHDDLEDDYYDHIIMRFGAMSMDSNTYPEDEISSYDNNGVLRAFQFYFDLKDGYSEHGNETYIKYENGKTIVTLLPHLTDIDDWYGYSVHHSSDWPDPKKCRIYFYVGGDYNDPPTILKVDSIDFYELDMSLYQLQCKEFPQSFQDNNNELSIDCGCQIYYKNAVTEGTRIAKDGMYSFLNSNSLFYLSTDYIEQRIDNTGIRVSRDLSDAFLGSAGLEVFYSNDVSTHRWSNNSTWVSLFNYKPILRFYATINSNENGFDYHVPALKQSFSSSRGQWYGGTENWIYEKLPFGVVAKDDTNYYYTWRYNIAYHRGDISIENINPDQQGTHFIILPMNYWESVYKKEKPIGDYRYSYEWADIPIGFCINIMICQYCSYAEWRDGGTGYIGIRKQRIVIGVESTNGNFLYTVTKDGNTTYTQGAFHYGNGSNDVPANFLDAHGDYCAWIEMTDGSGNYLSGTDKNNSFATFIWTGFIWKTSIDVDTRGQTGLPNDKVIGN